MRVHSTYDPSGANPGFDGTIQQMLTPASNTNWIKEFEAVKRMEKLKEKLKATREEKANNNK